MKVLFLTNNSITAPLADWLKSDGTDVSLIGEMITVKTIEAYSPAWVISYNYRHIIKEDVLALCPGRVINFHISLLPWNRGADPNLWSFLEDTPKGVTIHLIDKDIDSGPVLLKKEIQFDAGIETLGSSYTKLQEEIQRLFKINWGAIKAGECLPTPQPAGGSKHFVKDSLEFKRILGEDIFTMRCSDLKNKYAEYLQSLS